MGILSRTDYRLSQVQRNEVFAEVTRLQLDPAAFEWREETGQLGARIHRILHRPTGAFLQIDVKSALGEYYALDAWPNPGLVNRTSGAGPPTDWPSLFAAIARWLAAVKTEQDAPDMWALAYQEREWLSSGRTAPSANTSFTSVEVERIERQLIALQSYVISISEGQREQAEFVAGEFAYLRDAAERVGRVDWKNLALSTFLNVVVTLGFSPDKARMAFSMATTLLGELVAGAARLPSLLGH